MKKTFTKFIIPALALIFAATFSADAQIQTAPTDTANKARTDTTFKHDDFKPGGRLWGYAFGDLYFLQHADGANRGGETNYAGVAANRNAFQFRRIYLGYDYDISKKFSAEVLLAVEPNANTGTTSSSVGGVTGTTGVNNGDNLGDNKMSFFIKNFDLRWKGVWSGTDFIIGELSTPAFPLLSEKVWGYRSIERTIADFHKTNSYDLGASLQGVFDPRTKNYGYDLMIANNSQAALLPAGATNANTGFYKAFYGDLFAKFFNKSLIFDLYADYITTNASIAATATTPFIGQQHKNMVKGFIAYTTPTITFGVEAYTQNLRNGVTETSTATGAPKTAVNAEVQAISVYSRGTIVKNKIGFFARYDSYNPDADLNTANVYTVNTNLSAYSPYTKEHFITGGLDFTPAKNVHFMPNIWFIQYVDQRSPGTTGYVPEGHILVYRMTFFFQFGK